MRVSCLVVSNAACRAEIVDRSTGFMLRYKAMRHGVSFAEVDERNSTRVCSVCGRTSGPRGLNDLGVREWECSNCGVVHDRDINAAQNILLLGQNAGLRLTESPSL